MPKQKTKKTIAKRFKKTATGKLLKKHARTTHLKQGQDSSTKRRKRKLTEVYKGMGKKIRKLI